MFPFTNNVYKITSDDFKSIEFKDNRFFNLVKEKTGIEVVEDTSDPQFRSNWEDFFVDAGKGKPSEMVHCIDCCEGKYNIYPYVFGSGYMSTDPERKKREITFLESQDLKKGLITSYTTSSILLTLKCHDVKLVHTKSNGNAMRFKYRDGSELCLLELGMEDELAIKYGNGMQKERFHFAVAQVVTTFEYVVARTPKFR
jgi:hypothetical protein